MKRLRGMLGAIAASMLLLFAEPAQCGLQFAIGVRVPPPPPRREIIEIRPRLSSVWVKGHWLWSPVAGRHIWVPGMWVERRPKSIWVDGRWTRTRHGWIYIDGYWKRVRSSS